jgi:hypothetical protein
MNFAWFSALSRGATVALTSAAIGAMAWSGCGGGSSGYYCDNTGCYTCDGYGCSAVTPPSTTPCSSDGDCASGTTCTTHGCVDTCKSDKDCAKGTICTGGQCLPPGDDAGAPVECSVNSDCGVGKECKDHSCTACGSGSEGACPCTTASDCAKGQECYESACVTCGGTSGPCPCATSKDCATGDTCVAGSCEPSSTLCKFSSQCPSGDVCDDGQCIPTCSAGSSPGSACVGGATCSTKGVCVPPPGTTCKSSTDCKGADPFCVAGTCTSACTMDSQCPTGDYCDQGACVIDTRPKPNCTDSSQCDTAEGQSCVGGYCVFTCTTDKECALHDARIDICQMGVCVSPAQATPQCTTQAQCASGQDCISNTCQ